MSDASAMRTSRMQWSAVAFCAALACAGCAAPMPVLSVQERADLEQRALLTLTTSAVDADPAVRVRAAEALQDVAPQAGAPYFNQLLSDDSPAVRFAALMAVGSIRQSAALPRARALADDPNPNVQAAAAFAMQRLGDASRAQRLSDLLLHHADAGVRGNAALALGRLGDRGVAPLLQQALRDREESVRLQVMEALVQLGDRKTAARLGVIGLSNTGQKMVFALLALRGMRGEEFKQLFKEQFRSGVYDEVRLAAAIGLAGNGDDSGLTLAIERLTTAAPRPGGADTPEQQAARIKTLAAMAAEAIGSPAALGALQNALTQDANPTVRVAAARAVLAILHDAGRVRQP